MSGHNTIVRSVYDLGLGAWAGGLVANRVAADVPGPTAPRVLGAGWAQWAPVSAAAIAAHLIGGAGIPRAKSVRIVAMSGVVG
jgi:hypothetical protein